jgi:hypothetical protein
MHKEEKVYVPELIFGHLLTSSNYDDNEKKVTGGRNGYGAKLANIFSTEVGLYELIILALFCDCDLLFWLVLLNSVYP